MEQVRPNGALGPAVVRIARDAALLFAASAVAAVAFNALRRHAIPWVQHEEYAILVPCAEAGGEVNDLAPTDPLVRDGSSLVIDARSKHDFDAWHLPSAVSVPFDYLASVPDTEVKKLIASRATRVVVYGDGEDPDSGRELGRELAGKGLRNVFVVKGGAPALRTHAGGAP